MNTLRFIFSLLTITLLFSACQKNEMLEQVVDNPAEATNKIKAEVINGTLHFASQEDVINALKAMNKMSDTELDAWEEAVGFTSIRRLTNESIAKLNGLEDVLQEEAEARLTQILREEQWIELKDNTVEPTFAHPAYRLICNAEAIFSVSGYLNKVTDTHIIGIEGGDLGKLTLAEQNLVNNPSAGIHVYTRPEETIVEQRAPCHHPTNSSFEANGKHAIRLTIRADEFVQFGPMVFKMGVVYADCYSYEASSWFYAFKDVPDLFILPSTLRIQWSDKTTETHSISAHSENEHHADDMIFDDNPIMGLLEDVTPVVKGITAQAYFAVDNNNYAYTSIVCEE